MAWLGIIIIIIFYMDTQEHAICHVWIHLFPTSYARGEKPFGLELESNPGPLASQVTALTIRPCHLGQCSVIMIGQVNVTLISMTFVIIPLLGTFSSADFP